VVPAGLSLRRASKIAVSDFPKFHEEVEFCDVCIEFVISIVKFLREFLRALHGYAILDGPQLEPHSGRRQQILRHFFPFQGPLGFVPFFGLFL